MTEQYIKKEAMDTIVGKIANLNNKIMQKDSLIKELEEEKDCLKKKNDDLIDCCLRWERIYDRQQERIKDLEKKNDDLFNDVMDLKESCDYWRNKIQTLKKENPDCDELRAEIGEKDKEITHLYDQLKEQIDKNSNLKLSNENILQALKKARESRDHLGKRCKENEKIFLELCNERDQTLIEMDQMKEEIEKLRKEKNDLEEDNRRWEQVCNDQTDEIDLLKTNSECKDKHVKNLLERIKELETANESMDRLKKEDYMDVLKREAIENVKDEDPEVIRNWMVRIVEELFYDRPQRMSGCHTYKCSADHGYKYKPCRRYYSKHFDCHRQSVKRKKCSEKESE